MIEWQNRLGLSNGLAMSLTLSLVACGGSSPGVEAPTAVSVSTSLNAVDDAVTTVVNSTGLSIQVLANDNVGTTPTNIVTASASSGAVVIASGAQALQYDAPATAGTDTITYSIQDADGNSDSAQVVVTVAAAGSLPQAQPDNRALFKEGRGAPFAVSDLIANDDVASSSFTAISFPATTANGGSLILDDQGETDFNLHIIRYTPPAIVGASDSFNYQLSAADGSSSSATVTINLSTQGACDTDIAKREASGLGWCFETYFDAADAPDNLDGDGTGRDIAMQVHVPHPWHRRQLALRMGATLDAKSQGYTPLMVHSHGFGGSKIEDINDATVFLDIQLAKAAWHDGYNVISYTQRGFGGTDGSEKASGDMIRVMDPRFEGFDFIRVVDWAICHFRENAPLRGEGTEAQLRDPEFDNCGSSWGDSLIALEDASRLSSFDDDLALATTGYSYGGGYQFLAQAMDPRVDAIVPMGTWHDLRRALHPNDTPKTTWIQVMSQFSSFTPPLGGGNGEMLPEVIAQANAQSVAGNNELADDPHRKSIQVSTMWANLLGEKGASAFCFNNQQAYTDKTGDADGDPIDTDLANAPAHARDANGDIHGRAPRAHLFMIQGYGDTLFDFNEGLNNAQCFENAANAGVPIDVRMLQQISGHPFPTQAGLVPAEAIPPQYAGQDLGMYLDEIVHCGVDGNGQPIRYNMIEVTKQWVDFHLMGLLQNGNSSADDIFPQVCVTQPNADPDYKLDTADPFFNGTNSNVNAHKYSREGVTFDRVADVPLGGTLINLPSTTVVTGLTAALMPQLTTAELHTTSNPQGEVLAGVPLVHVTVTRQPAAIDEIVFAGTYVDRCNSDPDDTTFDGAGAPNNCTYPDGPELLHFQMAPIRPFPSTTAAGLSQPAQADFPQADPRNFPGTALGSFYPVIWGGNPDSPDSLNPDGSVISSTANPTGRLSGVSARLYPGDKVGLAFAAGHYPFVSQSSRMPGDALTAQAQPVSQVTIDGVVSLPLVANAPPAPPEPNDPCIMGTAAAAAGTCQ